mgnify:CR=1 FL=1
MDLIIYIIGLLQTINKSYRAEGKLLTDRRTDGHQGDNIIPPLWAYNKKSNTPKSLYNNNCYLINSVPSNLVLVCENVSERCVIVFRDSYTEHV